MSGRRCAQSTLSTADLAADTALSIVFEPARWGRDTLNNSVSSLWPEKEILGVSVEGEEGQKFVNWKLFLLLFVPLLDKFHDKFPPRTTIESSSSYCLSRVDTITLLAQS
jgi:hypothetical protein